MMTMVDDCWLWIVHDCAQIRALIIVYKNNRLLNCWFWKVDGRWWFIMFQQDWSPFFCWGAQGNMDLSFTCSYGGAPWNSWLNLPDAIILGQVYPSLMNKLKGCCIPYNSCVKGGVNPLVVAQLGTIDEPTLWDSHPRLPFPGANTKGIASSWCLKHFWP